MLDRIWEKKMFRTYTIIVSISIVVSTVFIQNIDFIKFKEFYSEALVYDYQNRMIPYEYFHLLKYYFVIVIFTLTFIILYVLKGIHFLLKIKLRKQV